jgi:hypothetical protein
METFIIVFLELFTDRLIFLCSARDPQQKRPACVTTMAITFNDLVEKLEEIFDEDDNTADIDAIKEAMDS